jgi:MFS family permease
MTGVVLGLTVMSDAFLYLVLQRKTGAAVESLPLFYIGTALCYLTLAIPVGRLADRIGRAPVYVGGHVLLAALYGVTLAWELNTAGLLVCIALYGAYYATTDGVIAALVSHTLRPDVRASGLGAVATGTSLAKLCGSVLLGAVWAWRGPTAVLTVCLVGTVSVLACVTPRLARLDARRHAAGPA